MQRQTVQRQFMSITQSGVNNGNTGTFQYTVPDGYTKLAQVIFDPEKDVLVTLFTQKAYKNIMTNFSTKIGNALGLAQVDYVQIANDILNLSWSAIDVPGGNVQLTFTLVFE